MFDFVDFTCDCPTCGKLIKGFQSKDGPCQLLKLKPLQVDRFYTACGNCNSWIEYVRDVEAPDLPEYGSMDQFKLNLSQCRSPKATD